MMTLILTLGAYLLGSIPFGVVMGYAFTGKDIRSGGSGHSGGTNTIRQAGWAAGVLTIVLDVAKGALAVWLGLTYTEGWWTPALAAGAVVAGHCWPIFAQFKGGMGLAPAGGVMMLAYPLGFFGAFGLLLACAFILKHSARAAFTTAIIGPVLIGLLSQNLTLTAIAVALGLVIAIRATSDWNHTRRAVWDVKGSKGIRD